MLKFHEESQKIFDFFIKVEKEKDSYKTKVLFPLNQEIPEVAKKIELFCFPYQQTITEEECEFYLCFTDSSKNLTYVYINRKKNSAYCLLTQYFHPKYFLDITSRISGVKDAFIPAACDKYVVSKVHHDEKNWRVSFNSSSSNISNTPNLDTYFGKISPSCEISRLYEFIFTKLPIPYILIAIVAISLDCRTIVISSQLSDISRAIFSLLALIYPIKWPGTFIPILPSSILTMLDAPFAYLIGIHSSTADALLSIDRYFLINIDFHYCASIGMEDFPPEVIKFVNERSDTLKKLINRYSPHFPFIQIRDQIRLFIRDLFGVAYNLDKADNFTKVFHSFDQWKSVPSDEFKAIFSQTQFINGFINDIVFEHNNEIYKAFWPNHVFIPPQQAGSPHENDNKDVSNPTGWRGSRRNSIGKKDLPIIASPPVEPILDVDNSSSDEDNKSDGIKQNTQEESEKMAKDQHTNESANINIKIDKTEISKDSDHSSENSSRRRKKKSNSVQLSSLNLSQINSSTNDSFLGNGAHASSARKAKKRRTASHRSQSVENHLLVKNNSFSNIKSNNQISKEAPNPSIKEDFPQFFDKTNESYIQNTKDSSFIDAPGDLNLQPVARKNPLPLPIPKKVPSKVLDIPSFDQTKKNIDNSDMTNNGSQSARVHRRKIKSSSTMNNEINFGQKPKAGIVASSSFHSRNMSVNTHKSHKENELVNNTKSKRSSSVSIQQKTGNNDEDSHTDHKRRRKRRTQSNLSDTENNVEAKRQKSGEILRRQPNLIDEPNVNDIPKDIKKVEKASSLPDTKKEISNNNQISSNNSKDRIMTPTEIRNMYKVKSSSSNNNIELNTNSYDKLNINTNSNDRLNINTNSNDRLNINTNSYDKLNINTNSNDRLNINTNSDVSNKPKVSNHVIENDGKSSPKRVIKSRPVLEINKDKTTNDDEIENEPIKKPTSPKNKPFKLRPLPGNDGKNKISPAQFKAYHSSINRNRQLTPRLPTQPNRNIFNDTNEQDKKASASGNEMSPTKKVFRNSVISRPRPKFKFESSDYADYDSDYSYHEEKPVEKPVKKPINVGSLPNPARVVASQSQRVLVKNSNSFARKRNGSFDTPISPPKPLQTAKSDEKTTDKINTGSSSPRNTLVPTRPRVNPNFRRPIFSNPKPNQPRTPPLIKFSSSSEYSE